MVETIPGIPTAISANSENGKIFILLHELGHVGRTGMAHNDIDPNVNAINNGIIWKNCEKTILGK